jgi:RHS repeat-associated protein
MQVTAFTDPVGHRITLGYNGSGQLDSLTDPSLRLTKVVIDATNHLVADTVPAANLHSYFTTFGYHVYSDSGLVLTSRTGVLGDATAVTYDSTFTRRPTQVTLAAVDTGGGSASPVIQYAAAEAQGFHALVATTASTVTITDPKLHWTTSQVNRWGAAVKTWDVLDTLARTRYTAEGLVQWTEGKVRDSSRVTTRYDAYRRPFKAYVIRGPGDTLRLDSLAYDTASRVVTSVDARGKASQIVYDNYGDVVQTMDPNSDTSRVWFGIAGHVDSTRAAGDTASTRYHYEGTWQNVDSVVDPSGALVSRYFYDGLGRDTATDAKVQVRVVADSFQWQWRRTQTFFNPINQADSTRVFRTANCSDPCNTPPAWPNPNDTTATMRVGYRYDRAGRDSLRLGDRGAATGHGVLYLYDLLGRLRSRHPWWPDSTAVRDSFVVDVGGNVKKTMTRRGDTVTVAFDSRNRDTSTVIPGVGTLRHIYGGPADQLTREVYAGLVDSIGGINPTRAWVFDSRGRLVADTGYTGSTARVTIYGYDHLDRDSTTTDAVGTAQPRYESSRGIVDTLIAATGDTTVYGLDGQGRPATGSVKPGSHTPMSVTWTWNVTHDLASIARGAQDPTGAAFDPGSWYKKPRVFPEGEHGATFLGPIWTQQPTPSLAADTLADTIAYDGWQRVTSWYERKDNVLSASETYTFDRDGNLAAGASETYDALTDRLKSRTDACGSWNYSYDRAGNVTQGTCGGHTWAYTYDALNELRSLRYDGTLIARYAYDGAGRRIAKRVYSSSTGGTVQYLRFSYHGANVAFETDSGGTLGNRYAWTGTDQLAAYWDGSGRRHTVVTDLLGSVRAQFTTDSGTAYQTQAYRPYGALVSGSWVFTGLRYGWTGREYDAELGYYYFRARYYDPGARRFVQEDPIGYAGGRNVYAYANGSPLNGTDADGTRFQYSAYVCDNCRDINSGLDDDVPVWEFPGSSYDVGLAEGAPGLDPEATVPSETCPSCPPPTIKVDTSATGVITVTRTQDAPLTQEQVNDVNDDVSLEAQINGLMVGAVVGGLTEGLGALAPGVSTGIGSGAGIALLGTPDFHAAVGDMLTRINTYQPLQLRGGAAFMPLNSRLVVTHSDGSTDIYSPSPW